MTRLSPRTAATALPRKPCVRRSRLAGISLLELMVTMAVLAIAAAAAQPMLGSLFDSLGNDMARALGSSLQLARSEAIKRASRATVCKSSDGERCSAAGSWGQGWIVFHDGNHNGSREAGENIIQVRQALPQRWRISGNSSVAQYVSFQADGSPTLVSGAFQAGTFTVCRLAGANAQAKLLVMSATGRLRVQGAAVQSCA